MGNNLILLVKLRKSAIISWSRAEKLNKARKVLKFFAVLPIRTKEQPYLAFRGNKFMIFMDESRSTRRCALQRLMLVCLVAASAACGSKTTAKKSGAAGPSVAGRASAVRFVNPDNGMQLAPQVTSMTGEPIRLRLTLEGGNPADYSMGVRSSTLGSMQVQGAEIYAAQVPAGSHSVEVVARNARLCRDFFPTKPDCVLNGQVPLDHDVALDVTTSIVINVVSNFNQVDTTGLGQGGGIIGQVIRGDGLIGSLAKNFMGGGIGGLGGGLGGQPTVPGQQIPGTIP